MRRASKRSTAPTNTAILTIGIHGAHKPHDNRLPNQESPPNREPRGTARGAADVSGFRPLDAANDGGVRLAAQRTTRPNRRDRTRRLATVSMAGHTDVPSRHNGPQCPKASAPRHIRLTPTPHQPRHEHTTLHRPGTNAADLADSSPAHRKIGTKPTRFVI